MNDTYIEVDGKAVQEPDMSKWRSWMKTADRKVGVTVVGDKRVYTVFLGLDYNSRGPVPILYETMVFSPGSYDEPNGEVSRYATREQALAGHKAMVKQLQEAQK